jgi:DNA-directed RNA polymerase subunit H (RpoH/RPB5)
MALNNSSKLISNIYNSRLNLLKQLDYQNYNIENYGNFSINEINAMYTNNQLDLLFEKKEVNPETNIKEKIFIKYFINKSLKINDLDEIINELFNLETILTVNDTLCIIVRQELNETMIEYLKYIYNIDKHFIIIQNLTRLQFNILEHSLVPNHKVISNQEIEEVNLRYNIINNNQFPKISRFDPVALAIGLRPGQICKIIRPSKTTISTFYYRYCENI